MHRKEKTMKLSVEAKVAAAVATAFVALTVGAIGQEHSGAQTGGLNGYDPAVNTYLSQQGYNNFLRGRAMHPRGWRGAKPVAQP